mmetsp:Transcript_35275/g.112207  ORF Transcript_35275/g.112207 Transcript_35275/m.112207 type:complete len:332 (-) Transcript_35275:139-1134(-)
MRGLHEALEGDVPVAPLRREPAGRGRGLPEQGVHAAEAPAVCGHGVAPVGLVHVHLALLAHVEPPLLRVHVALRRDPGAGVEGVARGAVAEVLPLHRQGDGVLRLHALQPLAGHAGGAKGCDRSWPGAPALRPDVEVHVVGVEVVGDVGGLAGPGLEGLELVLGLGHVAGEVGEGPEVLDPVAGVGVDRVEALVHLDLHEDVVLGRRGHQLAVVFQRLHGRLGDEHVHAALDARQGYLQVRVVRREDDGAVPRLEGLRGRPEGLRVHHAVRGEGLDDLGLDATVDVPQHALHVRADLRQLLAVDAAHAQPAKLATLAQIQADEANDARGLV